MRKTLIILRREYLHRVRKKSFILMTLLGPVLFGIMLILPVWLSLRNLQEFIIIEYQDHAGLLDEVAPPEGVYLIPAHHSSETDPDAFLNITRDGKSVLLVYNNYSIVVPVVKSLINKGHLSRTLRDIGMSEENIARLTSPAPLTIEAVEAQPGFSPAAAVGLILSIVVYLFILGYSLQVMRGVMEEKNSRVVELLLSSVKPFQLMAGKILGIGSVSLTQFLIWCFIGGLLGYLATERYGEALQLFTDENIEETIGSGGISIRNAMEWNNIVEAFQSVDLFNSLLLFMFYFIFGYMFYSAIFAAAGSALDSEAETQQFLFPLTLPILFTFVLAEHIIRFPSSALSFWLSVIPFTSPVAMLLRSSTSVPPGDLFISMSVLIISFILFTWAAGKIFRSAILFQGKKFKLKDLWNMLSQ